MAPAPPAHGPENEKKKQKQPAAAAKSALSAIRSLPSRLCRLQLLPWARPDKTRPEIGRPAALVKEFEDVQPVWDANGNEFKLVVVTDGGAPGGNGDADGRPSYKLAPVAIEHTSPRGSVLSPPMHTASMSPTPLQEQQQQGQQQNGGKLGGGVEEEDKISQVLAAPQAA